MLRITDGCVEHNGWCLLFGCAYQMVQITLQAIRTYLYLCVADNINIMYLGAIVSCSVREIIYISKHRHA